MKRGTAKLRALVRRRRFIRQYLAGPPDVAMNAARSVLAAGFTRNETSAMVIGGRFLANPEVQREIEKYSERLNVTTERVLAEVAKIAFSDARDLQDWGPDGVRLKDSRLISDAAAASVRGVKHTVRETLNREGTYIERAGEIALQRYDKVEALALLAKMNGWVVNRHEVSGPGGRPIQHEHVVFYLPAPTRLRTGITVVEATATDVTPSPNGDAPSSGNGGPLEQSP